METGSILGLLNNNLINYKKMSVLIQIVLCIIYAFIAIGIMIDNE